MLTERREELTRQRVQTLNRLQRLLCELIPGKGKKDLTALQAKAILASVRPRDLAGKTRKRLALEQLTDLVALDKKTKTLTAEPPVPGELPEKQDRTSGGMHAHAARGRLGRGRLRGARAAS